MGENAPVSAVEAAAELDQISVALRNTATGPNDLSSNASNKLLRDAASSIEALARQAEALQREKAELREALSPSGETKAAYIGEFKFPYTVWDPHGEFEITHIVAVPWTTVKEIMAAIRARALLGGENAE